MNHGITSHGGNREVKDTTLYFKKAWTYSRLFLFTSYPNGLRTADLSDLRNPRQSGDVAGIFFRKFQEIIFNFVEDFLY